MCLFHTTSTRILEPFLIEYIQLTILILCVGERSVHELQVTHKTDVFAFGVVLGELITGQRALFRDNLEPAKMKSLITVVSFN